MGAFSDIYFKIMSGAGKNIAAVFLGKEMIRDLEREVALKTRSLEEVNTALRVLVEQREKDRMDN